MNVNFNNTKYHIRFGYNIDGKWGKQHLVNLKNKKVKTQCDIFTKDENKNVTVIAVGESIRHPKDPFVKDYGRKVALQRALKNSKNISKEFRNKIWETYFKSHRTSLSKEN